MNDWKMMFDEASTLGILQYWSSYADEAEIPISNRNGWNIQRTERVNTLVLACDHPLLGFSLTMDVAFRENGFDVKISKESVVESKNNRVGSIVLLPDLCLRHEGDEGYYLIPQQSGVISRFSNKLEARYQIGIYGNGISECNMPIFGMTIGNELLAGIITSGQCDAALVIETARGKEKAYRLSPRFFFRYELHVRRQNMPIVSTDIECQIRCLPLGERTAAAVLAESYRNYRIQEKQITPLVERIKSNEILARAVKSPEIRIRLAVKWPFPIQVAAQTPENEPDVHVFCRFKQAQKIVDAFKQEGVRNLNICLVGWAAKGHDGRYPQILPVEESLGGESDLRDLIKHTQVSGYAITAHDNHYDAYRVSNDPIDDILIRTQEMAPMMDGVWGGGQAYLSCPEAMYKTYSERNLSAIRDLGFKGTHFTDCLSTTGLKVCWDPAHPHNRTEMAHWRRKILSLAKEYFGAIECEGSLDFAAGVLDRVMYIESDNGRRTETLLSRDYADDIVPLYEMVYHGIFLYNITAESINALPGSRAYLRNMAFGGMPSFYFYRHFATKNYYPGTNTPIPGKFETADFTLDNLAEEAQAVRTAEKDYVDGVGHLQLCFMSDFTQISDTCTVTRYSNGQTLYVNWSDETCIAEGKAIDSKSFLLVS